MLTALITMGTIYTAIVIVMMWMEPNMIFPAPPIQYGNWDVARQGGEETFVDSTDGTKVHVWIFRHKSPIATLVFCHGNGESLGLIGPELRNLCDKWKVNVVAFDYRGYGKTGGNPTQKSIYDDSSAVARFVGNSFPSSELPIVYYGRSLGGACALEMATVVKPDGLILDRTFSSMVDVAAAHYPVLPVRVFMRNVFPSVPRIKSYDGPLLQLHGKVDELIPYRFAVKLFEACPSTKKRLITIDNLYHNDAWPDRFLGIGEAFIRNLRK